MPPKKNPDGASAPAVPGWTEVDIRFANSLLKHMDVRPTADWEAMMQDLNLKNVKTVKDRLSQITKKHGWFEGAKSEEPSTPAAKKTPRSRKRAKASGGTGAAGDGDSEADQKAPAVKKRKFSRKKTSEEDEVGDAEVKAGASGHANGALMGDESQSGDEF